MEDIKLSTIKKVNLREVWNNEATDFTNWLAKDDSLALLSDEIGIEIKLKEIEASVGSFNVDILAEEENTGRKIVIENQLEITNHDHLGKIITYASGHDAKIIIWIVKEIRDEHKQAVDWLNEHTDDGVNFFIVKIELWKIEESPIAPKFQIISKPNDWAKIIKKSVGQDKLTNAKLLQLDFWSKFKELFQDKIIKFKLRSTKPQHWYDISIGNSDAHISLTINTRENFLGCEIYIPENKDLFKRLKDSKDVIEKELDQSLEWMDLPSKKASRIKISRDANVNNLDNWGECFDWLAKQLEKFYEVFSERVRIALKELGEAEINDYIDEGIDESEVEKRNEEIANYLSEGATKIKNTACAKCGTFFESEPGTIGISLCPKCRLLK